MSVTPSVLHPSPHRLGALAVALACVLVTPTWFATPALAMAPATAAAEETVPSDVTMVQANLKSSLSVEKFQADVREVMAETPDLVTYNEVPVRQDYVLAPEGYALHRDSRNRYTAATAVAWRTDRWTAIDQGTYRISNYPDKPPGRNIYLGRRYANWVTLESPEGRRLSVVAVHVAPIDKNMPDLLKPSVRRLSALVADLAPAGPVLMGGDFNVHYTSGRFPRSMFEQAGLVPTYDALGTYFPTGDHGGYTIDYAFYRGENAIAAEQHRPVELNSDHDAVVAGFAWQVDAPADTSRVRNRIAGDSEAQRRVVVTLAEQLRAADTDSQIDVVTSELSLRTISRALAGAAKRGVEVRVTTRSEQLTRPERRLARTLADTGDPESFLRQCRDECLAAWRDSGMARTMVLTRDTLGKSRWRFDVNRNLDADMVERRSELVLRSGEFALAEGEEQLASLG